MTNDETNMNFATEILHEVRASSRRWFIAFLVTLVLWFATIGAFIWYISLPVEDYDVSIENEDGNANYVGRDLNGQIDNGEDQSQTKKESCQKQIQQWTKTQKIMPSSNITMVKKLQQAINSRGEKILYTTSQFYSDEQDRPVTIYSIKKAIFDEKTNRNINIKLFSSTSLIQIVLYLRDYWYELNGQEPPTDNEEWNKIRQGLQEPSK